MQSRRAGMISNSKLFFLPPFTKNHLLLAKSALEIILKGINRVNYKKAVIITLVPARRDGKNSICRPN